MRLKHLLLTVVSLVAIVWSAGAQVTTSSLDGRVINVDGDPLYGTTVIAVHTPTGTSYAGVTDADGNYRLRNLRPGGPYTVTFSYVGYTTVEHGNISLVLAGTRVLNTTMNPDANMLEDIVVVADNYSATGNAGSVTDISTRDINLMPTISRNLTDLVRLTPQANGQSIGGGNSRQNYFTIDGGSFNNMFGIGASIPSGGSPVPLDAIDQMSVSITPYDVRQSGFIGAAVNAVTRSGTNEFVGSVYSYFGHEKFNGTRVGDNERLERVIDRSNILGARLGGPIIKNRLFFFANVEWENATEPGPTRRASSNGVVDRDNNIARPTAIEMDAISKYLADNYGYETGHYQGYSFDSPSLRLLARIDWNIHRNHKFTVRFSRTTSKYNNYPSTSTSPMSNVFTSGNRQDMSAMWFQNTGYFQEQNYTSLAAELNSSFLQGRVFNTFRVTYSDQDEPRSTGGKEFPFVDIKKDGTAFTSFGTEVFSYGNLRKVTQFTITDDVNWTMGRHNMTAGLQYEHTNTKNGFMRMGTGAYVFESWEDFIGNQKPSAYAITYSTADGYAQQFPSFNFNQFTAYIQDEIALGDRFDLTAGIRFDLPMYPKMDELQTHPMIIEQSFPGIDRTGGVHYDTSKMPKSRLMFSPRLGFNWDIAGNQSWILRGGTGIFTGRIPFVWIVSQSGDAGMLQLTQVYYGDDVPGPFDPDPKKYLPATPPTPGTSIPTGGFTVMDPNFKMPQTLKASLAVDVKLPWGMKGTIEGIYNRDINPLYVYKDGFTAPAEMNINGYPDHRLMYAYDYGARYTNRLNGAGALDEAGTYGANPLVVTNAPFSKGGYYASVTAQIEKSFDRGFSGMIAYTRSWGKNLHDGGGDQMNSVWNGRATVNGHNALEMGYAGYIVPNSIVASLSYEVFKGTTISLLYTGGDGSRFNYTYSRNIVNDGGGSNNLIYIPKDASEIDFVDYTYRDGNNTVVKWTAKEQSDAFFAYIDQDKYLSKHKGEYAERNGAITPWEHRFDVKVLQDFKVSLQNGKQNIIQVSLDIRNFANMLNRNWGGSKGTYQTAILNMTNAAAVAGGAKPTFQMVPLSGTSGANAQMVTETFRDLVGFGQTYSIRIGVRYMFN